jgi:cell division protein FtsL
MAKIVRTRKVRRINWHGIISLLTVFSVISFLITSVFAELETARLTKQIEIKKYEMAQKTDSNLEVAREINELRGYEAILAKAEDALMDFNLHNIVVVKSANHEEASK